MYEASSTFICLCSDFRCRLVVSHIHCFSFRCWFLALPATILQSNSLGGALRNLSVHSEFQKPIIKAGGIAATISAMDHHARDDKIQTLACGTLRNLAANISSKSPLEFGEKGVQLVLSAMQDPKCRNAKLAAQGCGVLRFAAKHGDYREITARLNGIPVIIETMELFQSDVAVQKEHVKPC